MGKPSTESIVFAYLFSGPGLFVLVALVAYSPGQPAVEYLLRRLGVVGEVVGMILGVSMFILPLVAPFASVTAIVILFVAGRGERTAAWRVAMTIAVVSLAVPSLYLVLLSRVTGM